MVKNVNFTYQTIEMFLHVTAKYLQLANIFDNQSLGIVPECTLAITNSSGLLGTFLALVLEVPYPGNNPSPEQTGYSSAYFLFQAPEKLNNCNSSPSSYLCPRFYLNLPFHQKLPQINLLAFCGPV